MASSSTGGLLRKLVAVIGVLTVATGALQVVVPGWVLGIIGAQGEPSATARTSFAIVGMFMVLFGGLLLHALASEEHGVVNDVALLWCALQKLGASAAVGVGVLSGIFVPLALGVAALDLASGVLFFIYRSRHQAGS